ncbi:MULTISPECIES: pyridoxal-phosphate-dependent aminotransferase family protein [Caldilinea]|jgi:predicted phosphoserine aminotransferase|uniref:Putative aminotransferase n=1 Tax=Caldilinea aerophila (strain DSM 14535 / JCM 11387 / NBRC 104270 / STL-6-O1) TaxID=926550 RepID=I0I8C1_CALAS|nr:MULTISPECIES: alanine--glyoxylate aminotransferase family protein [Caldilinea]MBO9394263.1 alanine--glyoxylate aminotransferase family protein [Caldilinea sp.]BAM01509.1 putative aminotransferase [Caldilinea aerophila DSM 14535 = NBRC 104270]GIV72848.1 MAG: aminotransferase [Caldilinea sp.]
MHEQQVIERTVPGITRHRQRLFIPGPTDVAPEVLAAQTAPMIGHRSDEFEALFAKCEEQLRTLFYTNARVYIVAASGTGLQEAAIRNLVARRVMCFVNGAFSQRWADVASGCDKEVVRVDIPWNTAVKPEQVTEALDKALAEGPVEAITVVHNETSTGVMSPIREIAAAVHNVSPETLVLIDAVSSFSGTRIETDAWGLDVVLTSSQKALAVPPGLALCAVSDRALAKAETVKGRGWYFDFVRLEKALKKSTTPATPAISLMRSLSVQLDRIFAEGLDVRFARHARLAERTQRWAIANGFELMAEEGYRSHTLTTVTNTRGISVKHLNAYLARHDMEISNGYGDYKDKAFRIAHMGEVQEEDLDRLFTAIESYLAGQN